MRTQAAVLAGRYFLVDFLGGILRFPFWWWSGGLRQTQRFVIGSAAFLFRYLALGIWVKNLFVPMYGDTVWSGRIFSFFLRLIIIAFRGLIYLVGLFVLFVLFILYVFWLPLAVLGFIYHAAGLFLS